MCQMVVSHNKLGNCDVMMVVPIRECLLILKRTCSSISEFCNVSATKDIFKLENELKFYTEHMFILVKTLKGYLHTDYNLFINFNTEFNWHFMNKMEVKICCIFATLTQLHSETRPMKIKNG